ncbi:MAG: RHS repeat-associated core domain-containing protein, partial [Candidatus Riflebacteria bacterium]
FKLHGKCRPGKEDLKLFREFVGGPSADDMSHTRYGKLSFAMLKDGLGSTIALTGKEARPIARINYDAWGNFRWHGKDCKNSPCTDDDFDDYLDRLEGIRSFGHGNHNGWAFGRHFGSRLTPYLYTGRRYSEITNQTWHRNRYYSPALGRFVSKDPIGFAADVNLYRYADGNPILKTDPSGKSPSAILGAALAAGAVVGIWGGACSYFAYKNANKLFNEPEFENDNCGKPLYDKMKHYYASCWHSKCMLNIGFGFTALGGILHEKLSGNVLDWRKDIEANFHGIVGSFSFESCYDSCLEHFKPVLP